MREAQNSKFLTANSKLNNSKSAKPTIQNSKFKIPYRYSLLSSKSISLSSCEIKFSSTLSSTSPS